MVNLSSGNFTSLRTLPIKISEFQTFKELCERKGKLEIEIISFIIYN